MTQLVFAVGGEGEEEEQQRQEREQEPEQEQEAQAQEPGKEAHTELEEEQEAEVQDQEKRDQKQFPSTMAAVGCRKDQLQPFDHQVAGQSLVFSYDRDTICKSLIQRELQFYRTMPDGLRPHAPEFRGVVDIPLDPPSGDGSSAEEEEVAGGQSGVSHPLTTQRLLNKVARAGQSQDNVYRFILLENLVADLRRPCMLDVKMGTRQHGDLASPEKVQYQTDKCRTSTSAQLGVRLMGMKVYQITTERYIQSDKSDGRRMGNDNFRDAMLQFLFNGRHIRRDLIPSIVLQLKNLKSRVAQLPSYRFYSSSLLIVYEGDEEMCSSCCHCSPKVNDSTSSMRLNGHCNHEPAVSLCDRESATLTFKGVVNDRPNAEHNTGSGLVMNGRSDGDSQQQTSENFELQTRVTHGQALQQLSAQSSLPSNSVDGSGVELNGEFLLGADIDASSDLQTDFRHAQTLEQHSAQSYLPSNSVDRSDVKLNGEQVLGADVDALNDLTDFRYAQTLEQHSAQSTLPSNSVDRSGVKLNGEFLLGVDVDSCNDLHTDFRHAQTLEQHSAQSSLPSNSVNRPGVKRDGDLLLGVNVDSSNDLLTDFRHAQTLEQHSAQSPLPSNSVDRPGVKRDGDQAEPAGVHTSNNLQTRLTHVQTLQQLCAQPSLPSNSGDGSRVKLNGEKILAADDLQTRLTHVQTLAEFSAQPPCDKPCVCRGPGKVDVRMVDFVHTTFQGYTGDSVVHSGVDQGYLLGLQTLIDIFTEFCASDGS